MPRLLMGMTAALARLYPCSAVGGSTGASATHHLWECEPPLREAAKRVTFARTALLCNLQPTKVRGGWSAPRSSSRRLKIRLWESAEQLCSRSRTRARRLGTTPRQGRTMADRHEQRRMLRLRDATRAPLHGLGRSVGDAI
jgi:hypothetical protein